MIILIPGYEIRKNDFSVTHNFNAINFREHIHRDMEILYMRKGRQRIHLSGKEYIVNQGEAAIFFPNMSHDYFIEDEEGLETDEIIIICSHRFYKNYFPSLAGKKAENPIITSDMISEDAHFALEHIDWRDDFNAQIAFIILIMTRLLKVITITDAGEESFDDLALNIVEFVNQNYTHSISLDMLSKTFYVNNNIISKIFSKQLKMSFSKYLRFVRVQHAALLLRTTNDTMISISEQCGFETQRTFNRAFLDIYKMTPHEFRTNI